MLRKFSCMQRQDKLHNFDYSTHIFLQYIEGFKTEVYGWFSIFLQNLWNSVWPVSATIADLTFRAFVDIHLHTCIVLHGYFSLRPVDQQQRQLAVRLYSKWYCATSKVDVLARRFSLALKRYIVCERAMVYLRKLMSNVFFLKKFTFNYVLNFLYIIFNEKSFWRTE